MQKGIFVALALFSFFSSTLSYAYYSSYDEVDEPSFRAYDDGAGYSFTEANDNSDYTYDVQRDERYTYASNESYGDRNYSRHHYSSSSSRARREHSHSYTSRLPSTIAAQGEKVIIVDPRVHAWGAYTADGKLLRSGLTTAGNKWCNDLGRPCRTRSGTFRIYSLGNSSCVSKRFPLGEGGAPMPYCMFFNGGQALHGSYEVVAGNVSHGCVRMTVDSARWIRQNFARIGTKVIVRPY
jgi:lipoprotein-anchoring transpeptidase ErfK/SrfK